MARIFEPWVKKIKHLDKEKILPQRMVSGGKRRLAEPLILCTKSTKEFKTEQKWTITMWKQKLIQELLRKKEGPKVIHPHKGFQVSTRHWGQKCTRLKESRKSSLKCQETCLEMNLRVLKNQREKRQRGRLHHIGWRLTQWRMKTTFD